MSGAATEPALCTPIRQEHAYFATPHRLGAPLFVDVNVEIFPTRALPSCGFVPLSLNIREYIF